MKCKNCTSQIPANSRFCLKCGTPLDTTTPAVGGANTVNFGAMAAQQNAKQNRWAMVLILLLIGVGAGAMFLKVQNDRLLSAAGRSGSNGLVQAPGQGNLNGLVQAPGEGNKNGLVQAPGATDPNKVTQAPTEGVPADVDDYLKFLKRIEMTKQSLIRSQLGDALGMLPMAQMMRGTIEEGQLNQSIETFDKKYNKIAGEWNQLTTAFQQRNPPNTCRDLHNKYYLQLSKMQQFTLEAIESLNTAMKAITDSMQGGSSNAVPQDQLSKLSDLKGRASPEMDDAIRKADDALSEVCDRYRLRKEFDIKGDPNNSGMMLR